MKEKDSNKLHNQTTWFVDYLERTTSLDKHTKADLLDTLGVKTWLAWLLRIFGAEKLPADRKEAIIALCETISHIDSNELVPLEKLRLKNNESNSYYLNLAHEDFDWALPADDKDIIIAYRIYYKYREYLSREAANKTSWWHTLRYNTTVQNLRHKRTYGWTHFGKGVYFMDTDEQYVLMEKNEKEGDKELNIKKYIYPCRIRIRKATESTVDSIKLLNTYNPSLPQLSIQPGDYTIEVNIWPHPYEWGKHLREAYKKLQTYLSEEAYSDIINNDKRLWKDTKREDIHIPFLYWITALTPIAKANEREVRKMPLETAKKTSTYMYWFLNPHAKYTEPVTLRRATAPQSYKELKRMSDKFDARDISFAFVPLEDFLAQKVM